MQTVTQGDIDLLMASGQFDPAWYRRRYADVDMLGMDPAEHYLRYGFRIDRDPGPDFSTRFYRTCLPGLKDWHEPLTLMARAAARGKAAPAPDPKRVLLAAYAESLFGRHDRAIVLAERHLAPEHAHTAQILRANAAQARGDLPGWLDSLNAYLAHFGMEPVALAPARPGQGLIDRFSTAPLPAVSGGPLVSVIMPAWNAEATVGMAARSVLAQTWSNLELLIVDDCSTDGTWSVLQALAASDPRVRIRRNPVNVGPYVSKNLALSQAQGDWITGHDADDWAHPKRIESHLRAVLTSPQPPRASLTYMVRMQPGGHFDTVSRVSEFSPDGVTRVSSISTLFERRLLRDTLGFWDSVRFGADSEMISRTRRVLGAEFAEFHQIGMICLSTETSLTGHPEFGIRMASGKISDVRSEYKAAWTKWHAEIGPDCRLDLMPTLRRFDAPAAMKVPAEAVLQCQLGSA